MSFEPKYIILHCSDTADSGTVSWGAIRKFHEQTRGWKTIGYHAGCELVGNDYECLVGRPWDEEGAHCRAGGRNHDSLGLCLVGSFDQRPPMPRQIEVARDRIIIPWMKMFGIPPSKIMFHRDYDFGKTCPGRALTKAWLSQFVPGIVV